LEVFHLSTGPTTITNTITYSIRRRKIRAIIHTPRWLLFIQKIV
jgi:hypothetical protein